MITATVDMMCFSCNIVKGCYSDACNTSSLVVCESLLVPWVLCVNINLNIIFSEPTF